MSAWAIDTSPWVVFFAALGGLGGLGGLASLAYIGVTRQRIAAQARKIGVDADDVLSGRALDMYDRANKAAAVADAKAETCRAKLDAVLDHVDHLERLMRDAGMHPPQLVFPPTTVLQIEAGSRDE